VGHHMDVVLRGCDAIVTGRVPPHMIWTTRPATFYPSAIICGGCIESVQTVAGPTRVRTVRSNGVTVGTDCRWSVKHCSLVKVILCDTFDFRVEYRLRGSHLCFVGVPATHGRTGEHERDAPPVGREMTQGFFAYSSRYSRRSGSGPPRCPRSWGSTCSWS
jgi:hypothetical protein